MEKGLFTKSRNGIMEQKSNIFSLAFFASCTLYVDKHKSESIEIHERTVTKIKTLQNIHPRVLHIIGCTF